ncbi:MAG: Si-specific NAD(P)(+) transhydrogenase [Pseudomonadota bacterium]
MSRVDVFVIGSGPAGQKAAIQAAKGGLSVAICERLREVGGACVQFGTIPSKTLRERAVSRTRAMRELARSGREELDQSISVADLIGETGAVLKAHDRYMTAQLERNGVLVVHGRARFLDPHAVEVQFANGQIERFEADHIVIASGSKPRRLPHIETDHEHIYDSDSVLSLGYLPRSMMVFGGGVIACEYASIFALLGVEVTLIDRYPMPLGFLDADLASHFLEAFERLGGVFRGECDVRNVTFDGVSAVIATTADGEELCADKALCALGRVSQVADLNIEAAGLTVNDRELIDVDDSGRTAVAHIYAAGDVVGPPSLASASMEQGRRAACALLGIDPGDQGDFLPSGIYSVPELASVGLTEAQARERFGDAVIGKAHYREIARGLIADSASGLLKLIAAPDGKLVGVHIVGAAATDLIHIGQMALIHGAPHTVFIENVFNFPTYAESYRVAALDLAAALREGGQGRTAA